MLNSQILTQSRLLSADTDSTNPYTTDAQGYFYIDNWGIDLARYLKYPRKIDVISFAIGDGAAATSNNMDNDIITILGVTMAPSSGSSYLVLKPRTESEMDNLDPAWRDTGRGNAKPAYYIIRDTIAVGTSNFPQKTITTDRSLDEAMTMRIHGIMAPAPLGSTGTNSPALPPEFHETGTYFTAWKMLLPRNPTKAEDFRRLYINERRRIKAEWAEFLDSNTEVWDVVETE